MSDKHSLKEMDKLSILTTNYDGEPVNKPIPKVFMSYGMHDVPMHKQESIRHKLILKASNLLAEKGYKKFTTLSNHNCPGLKSDGRLHYLGHAIQLMDKCYYIIFADDWQEHKGCCIEHQVATLYGIEILSD